MGMYDINCVCYLTICSLWLCVCVCLVTWWRQWTEVLHLVSESSIFQQRFWRHTSCPHGSSPSGRLPGLLPRSDWLTGPCLEKWGSLLSAFICLWRFSSLSETILPSNSWRSPDRLLKGQNILNSLRPAVKGVSTQFGFIMVCKQGMSRKVLIFSK